MTKPKPHKPGRGGLRTPAGGRPPLPIEERAPETRALSVRVEIDVHAYWKGKGEELRALLTAKAREER